jgi:hypothetical protein
LKVVCDAVLGRTIAAVAHPGIAVTTITAPVATELDKRGMLVAVAVKA